MTMRFATELRQRRSDDAAPRDDVGAASRPQGHAPVVSAAPTPEARLRSGAGGLGRWLSQPQVRSVLIGVLLIAAGVTVLSHSVWTLPVVIVGLLMVIVAWVGKRLEGRFAIEWSDAGAGFEMHARVKASRPALGRHGGIRPVVMLEEPIEGEAHTVEIDTDELKALIEAAERGAAEGARVGRTSAGPARPTAVS